MKYIHFFGRALDDLIVEMCKNEKFFSKEQLLAEIYSILSGEYIANFDYAVGYLSIEFLNGQKFKIFLEETTAV